jgi:hypothetical protein
MQLRTAIVLSLLVFLLRAGATAQNDTIAVLTSLVDKVEPYQTTNAKMINAYFKPHYLLHYYYPNTSPRVWTDFDAFQAGPLIATSQLQRKR